MLVSSVDVIIIVLFYRDDVGLIVNELNIYDLVIFVIFWKPSQAITGAISFGSH